MKSFPAFPCSVNEAILKVSSYEDGLLIGRLIHPQLDNPKEIRSIPQLLFLLDELLEGESPIQYQALHVQRCPDEACIATLRIRILFREHHSWQGTIIWEERQREATFRSVLDLIYLLDEVLA